MQRPCYLYRALDGIEAQALDAAVERYGRFLGVPATLRQPQYQLS